MATSLIYPMFAMVLLAGFVLMAGLKARIAAVKGGDLPFKYFRTMTGAEPPETVVKTSRNFINLFEAPVLFYVACLVAMIQHVESPAVLAMSWLYVALRYTHTFIHLGPNNVLYRMRVYATSWAVLMAIWFYIVLKVGQWL